MANDPDTQQENEDAEQDPQDEVIQDTDDGAATEDDPPKPGRFNVSSYGWDSDVEGLVKRLVRGDIYVPGFQRGFVWSPTDKSRFIESLILGLPVPTIFLAQDSKKKTLNIVDGQQRLLSLRDYIEGKFYLSGKDLQEELRGRYFSREVTKSKSSKVLEDADARTLSDAVMHSTVIKPDPTFDDPSLGHEYNEAIIQIFKRLNTSGKPLQAHEVRTSIFYGALDRMLRELNDDENWRAIFGKKHSRLKDMELILRFVALRESYQDYRSPMPRFLDRFMEESRDFTDDKAEELKAAFRKVTALVMKTVGRDGLRSGNSLTVSRFDAIMSGFDELLTKQDDPAADLVQARLKQMEADPKYQWSIDEFVNDTDRVKTRVERARSIFGA